MRVKVDLCGECVWVSKWAAQLKTILDAKWEVPVSKRERLPKRVVTVSNAFLISMKHAHIRPLCFLASSIMGGGGGCYGGSSNPKS